MSDADSTWSQHYWDDYPPSGYLVEQVDGIVIFGESQVGKTCFLDQHLKARPSNLYHDNRHLMSIDGHTMKADFMDLSSTTLRTAGPTFNPDFFIQKLSRAVGVVLIYDVTSLETFEHITDDAYMSLWTCKTYLGNDIGGKSCECILVGNKADIVEKEPGKRKVDKELAEQWAHSQGMKHFELTAREHAPVREAVLELMRAVRAAKVRKESSKKQAKTTTTSSSHVESKPLRTKILDVLRVKQNPRGRLALHTRSD